MRKENERRGERGERREGRERASEGGRERGGLRTREEGGGRDGKVGRERVENDEESEGGRRAWIEGDVKYYGGYAPLGRLITATFREVHAISIIPGAIATVCWLPAICCLRAHRLIGS